MCCFGKFWNIFQMLPAGKLSISAKINNQSIRKIVAVHVTIVPATNAQGNWSIF